MKTLYAPIYRPVITAPVNLPRPCCRRRSKPLLSVHWPVATARLPICRRRSRFEMDRVSSRLRPKFPSTKSRSGRRRFMMLNDLSAWED